LNLANFKELVINVKQCYRKLKFFQTCMNMFFLLYTKEDILKNMGYQTVEGPHLLP